MRLVPLRPWLHKVSMNPVVTPSLGCTPNVEPKKRPRNDVTSGVSLLQATRASGLFPHVFSADDLDW